MSDRAEGQIIGDRYRLTKRLGAGGMGEVWAAENTVTGKMVALKFLKAELAQREDVRRRFIREARAACAVKHPNVVEVHDVLDIEGTSPTMVMELLDGESLADKLERERTLSVADVARILLPVCAALQVAHRAGIVHRDLKPDNIYLADREVKVLDFGIAKIRDGASISKDGLTKTGSMLGTPYYMSPEQAYGEKDIDERSDIWSLGIIFYECLTGKRPTETDNFGQILKIITADGIPPIRTAIPDLPSEMSGLVDRMLERDRAKRPKSMEDVAKVLAKHASVSIRVPAPTVSGVTSGFDATVQATLTPVSGRQQSIAGVPKPMRVPWFWVTAGVVGVAGTLFAISKLTAHDPAPDPTPSASVHETARLELVPPPIADVALAQPVFDVPEAGRDATARVVVRPAAIVDAAVTAPPPVTTNPHGPHLVEDAPF